MVRVETQRSASITVEWATAPVLESAMVDPAKGGIPKFIKVTEVELNSPGILHWRTATFAPNADLTSQVDHHRVSWIYGWQTVGIPV